MREYRLSFRAILGILLIGVMPSAFAQDSSVSVTVDWTKSVGKINRPIFSTQGFMQVYVEPNPMVMETFELLNPTETHTRLEIYIHKMEPENDNDDPGLMNWERFYPQKMVRFIEDRSKFDRVVDELGMERLGLLCYMVPWLDSGDPQDPIRDKDEWAEFAAAVTESYDGAGDSFRPNNLRYLEIWNEPNMEMFYTGTMESYFELFEKTADRIHRDYPGVMVGGPALTHAYHCAPEEWMKAFMERCAVKADYISYHHYGPQGEPVSVITDDIKRWVGEFRKIPGKEQGKVMLTELDSWFHGWPKAQFILERQFRLLDLSDLILGIHHFCAMAYNESGNYTFGVVDQQGGVLGGTFWPYWLFRNLIGEQAYAIRQGERQQDVDLAASFYSREGQWMASAVLHNRTAEPLPVKAHLYFPPVNRDRLLVFNRITEATKGVERVMEIPAGDDAFELAWTMEPGEGLALNLQEPGKRLFAFRDLNNQEQPWVGLSANSERIEFQKQCELNVRILNTTVQPVSGKIELRGLPKGWLLRLAAGSDRLDSLAPGQARECQFTFTASSLTMQAKVSPYAVVLPESASGEIDLDQTPHSIAVSLPFVSPIEVQPLPLPIFAVAGETNQLSLQIRNQSSGDVEGTFLFRAPIGFGAIETPEGFRVAAGRMARFQFPFQVPANAAPGTVTGGITIQYLGTELVQEYSVQVTEGKAVENALPLDLSPWINFDAVAFFSNRTDYTPEMGMFVYPGDYTPSGRIVRTRGIPYRMASLEDGLKNSILPRGQVMEMPAGKYQGVAFMGFGHSGKHPGTWKFHYADNSVVDVESQIPEWCTPPPEGFSVAFTAPYRYIPGGPALPPCELFVWTLPLDGTKDLKAIELPTMENAFLFAVTLIP